MGQQTIYPGGSVEVLVPDGQKIAIANYGGGIAQIYYKVGGGNVPPAWQFQQTLQNAAVTLGTFTGDQLVRVDANNSMVIYEVAVSPSSAPIDAATLGGLTASQFLRSDAADYADGIITFTAGATLENNIGLNAEEAGGTSRTIAKINTGDEAQFGNANLLTKILSNGTVTIPSANVVLDNNQNLYGEDTGTTNRVIARISNGDVTEFANTALPTNIRSNGTVNVSTANIRLDNNYKLQIKDSGATVQNILNFNSSDEVLVGTSSYPLFLLSDGTVNIPAANAVLDNSYYLRSKELVGTVRALIGMNSSDIIRVGGAPNQLDLYSNGNVNILASNAVLDNTKYLQGKETGGTARNLAGIDGSNICILGNSNNTTNIASNGTVNVPAANVILDNNQFHYGADTGAVNRALIGIDNSDITQVGNSGTPTNIRSNGTLTYNGASLATGSIDTTAAQTITVVDGLITSIV